MQEIQMAWKIGPQQRTTKQFQFNRERFADVTWKFLANFFNT